ncbi:MAG: site-specific DNA-methyltransferase, partial [Corynebacterium sp.]|uniref:DNA methyltransferase n=1 Tax=Corynebacterium sp. TaxID=1720 RepID=UPI0026DF905D
PNFLDFHAEYNRVAAEGGVSFRNGKKPEALLRQLIEMFTAPGELVLDYHLGSGTTAAVALKLGRRFLGIEREDYARTVALPRLEAVVSGEQSGISAEVGWSGGGSVHFRQALEDVR